MNEHARTWRPSAKVLSLVGAPVVGIIVGAAVAWANSGPINVVLPRDAVGGESSLGAITPDDQAPLAARASGGISVAYQGTGAIQGGRTAIFYKVSAEAASFAQMLGTPRVLNPDGSIVLPEAYGENGPDTGSAGGPPGLPAGSSSALFESAQIQPGATVRFGPFFRTEAAGFQVRATGAELFQGVSATIGGENFKISANVKGGLTTITFINTSPAPTVMATHPASRETVTLNGQPVDVVHGSGNFAKDSSYDVNANQSTIVIQGALGPDTNVSIANGSIGRVIHGNWDFKLD